MVGHGGLSVAITIDGGNGREPLREYDAPGEGPGGRSWGLKRLLDYGAVGNTGAIDRSNIAYKVKYVEAVLGQRFGFRFIKDSGFQRGCHHLGIKWQIDGNNSTIRHELFNPRQPDAPWFAECNSIQTGNDFGGFYSHYFKFGKVQTVDDIPSDEQVKHLAQSFGTLRVFVYKMNQSNIQSSVRDFPTHSTFDVPEAALKGQDQPLSVHFDTERTSAPQLARPTDVYQDPQQLPCAVFEFRYRSREGTIPNPQNLVGANSRLDEDVGKKEHAESPESATRNSPLPPSDTMKRKHQDTASLPKTTPYKETEQKDGTIVIDLDYDSELEYLKTSPVKKKDPKTPSQNRVGVSGSANDGSKVKRRKQSSGEAGTRSSGKSKQVKDEQVERRVSPERPDRRVRCETVVDEGTLECTDSTVIHQYQIHQHFMDVSELEKDAEEVGSQCSADTMA
ncbi:hypothetical protein G7054_g8058 [Neopestalotiopsis clavispora]|nr:hypothetical protein G7054_g8058 [Neopestalotiopsis clavispora]